MSLNFSMSNMAFASRTGIGLQRPPILYFVHIPKTAGVTLKTWLEDHISLGRSFVVDEWDAAKADAEDLQQYRFFSGHYSSDVLRRLSRQPDFVITLIRDPMARFLSWSAHCRRVSDPKYRDLFDGRSDLEVIRGRGGHTCRQAHWLLRALKGGQSCSALPSLSELADLLSKVDLVGVTDEVDRFMQLVAFHLDWPPPSAGWQINCGPKAPEVSPHVVKEISGELLIDFELYRLAKEKFRQAYGAMVAELDPFANPEVAAGELPPFARVQELLRARYIRQFQEGTAAVVSSTRIDFAEALEGEGWWWRECPHSHAYRWSGPETTSEIYLPPLEGGRHYRLTMEIFGAANWTTWEQLRLSLNGVQLPVVRENMSPVKPHNPELRLVAHIDPEIAERGGSFSRIALHVPETLPVLKHVLRKESFDTYNYDERRVGVAVHCLEIEVASAPAKPILWTRRY